jgi:hypothetical protein
MRLNLRDLVRYLFQISSILFLASCTINVTIPKEIGLTSAGLSNKIPLKAGLYLTNEFKNARYPLRGGERVFGLFSVGDALSSNSENIIRDVFQETVTLGPTEITSASLSQKCDVVITPEVVRLHFEEEPTIPARAVVQTIIKWNIVSPAGKEIYSTTIKSDDITIYRPRGKVERTIVQSLKDNFEKAREDIYTSAWWKKQWWKSTN